MRARAKLSGSGFQQAKPYRWNNGFHNSLKGRPSGGTRHLEPVSGSVALVVYSSQNSSNALQQQDLYRLRMDPCSGVSASLFLPHLRVLLCDCTSCQSQSPDSRKCPLFQKIRLRPVSMLLSVRLYSVRAHPWFSFVFRQLSERSQYVVSLAQFQS